ncbi:MAG TPA: UDP-N-acetylmuramate dehydrogenase [Rhodanobacteraceae bacterium]|nr:UDP-N-acetylmuramate dehydrogenase [Rhodanobacteraceae bacterium]
MTAGCGYSILENAALDGRNTFRVAARAHRLIDVRRSGALPALFDCAAVKSAPLLVLGSGSNILFTRDWPGVVLAMSTRGIQVAEDLGDRALVRVAAGENWADFVRWSLDQGFVGLENLALIPGTVGAAPIQNIGAYGVELREFVHAVHAFDRVAAAMVRLTGAECAFTYRDSLFKREPGRHVISEVELTLPRRRALRLDYVGVREELAAMGVIEPTAPAVAEAIVRLRTRKLPNPALVGNAGSFFKNPLVDVARLRTLRAEYPALPHWPADAGRAKLSAAWLIETCGFKGLQEGDAAVSDQHALVLVNRGAATGAQILALSERIRAGVRARFAVEIEPEPVIA